jgi:hypothetical protein
VSRPEITPDMKVGELLRGYPELEDVLVALSPEFQRLKNPVLRATVAKLATLRQVAQVGGISVGDVIRALRAAAGETGPEAAGVPAATCGDHANGVPEHGGAATGPAPAWFDTARVVRVFDARPVIEGGGHPLGQVVQAAEALRPGEILELVTPFEPAPLIDVVRQRGFLAWVDRAEGGTVRTWFQRE